MYQPTVQKRHKLVDIPKKLLINEVTPGSLLMTTVLSGVEPTVYMPFLFHFFNCGKKLSILYLQHRIHLAGTQHDTLRKGGC